MVDADRELIPVGNEQQLAFDALKEAIFLHPQLQNLIYFVLDTDASLLAIGDVLPQRIDGKEYVLVKICEADGHASLYWLKNYKNYIRLVNSIQKLTCPVAKLCTTLAI